MTNPTQSQILRMERDFDCTLDEMWAAWTDPKQLARWISPFPGIDAEVHELDAREGGRIRFTMIDAQGKRYPEEKGVFEVLRKPHEIVQFSPNDERDDVFKGHPQRMKARFERIGPTRTRVHFETNLAPGIPLDMAQGGFGSCFRKLEQHLAAVRGSR